MKPYVYIATCKWYSWRPLQFSHSPVKPFKRLINQRMHDSTLLWNNITQRYFWNQSRRSILATNYIFFIPIRTFQFEQFRTVRVYFTGRVCILNNVQCSVDLSLQNHRLTFKLCATTINKYSTSTVNTEAVGKCAQKAYISMSMIPANTYVQVCALLTSSIVTSSSTTSTVFTCTSSLNWTLFFSLTERHNTHATHSTWRCAAKLNWPHEIHTLNKKQTTRYCHAPFSSGSAVRSAETKLAGKSPSPRWFEPFHQLGSL